MLTVAEVTTISMVERWRMATMIVCKAVEVVVQSFKIRKKKRILSFARQPETMGCSIWGAVVFGGLLHMGVYGMHLLVSVR